MKLLNRSNTKKALLDLSQERRGGKFTRVSQAAIDYLETQHRLAMENLVRRHPSIGKTLTAL
jgi:hypothetical protein|tara:strand:+ start:3520 stop:3705 length:186 start_codon:yes stop_codon:yes gene_type:complete